MGNKKIWDGKQLPGVGDEVLIHLGSADKWCPYIVEGFHIWPSLEGDTAYHSIFVDVYCTSGSNKIKNSRLLRDVRPIFWREGDEYDPCKEPTK
ncbi:hypothetical protein CUN67_13050 [Pantoea cypripedii]|uniref:Uncharacterized protein n=2 Tax=Pantoea cypripedii TaxID=55209 RepID=A0A6B9FYC7_PANCY|nr:hypothetical protein CUN67_13050 [Pantoea cypripedii]